MKGVCCVAALLGVLTLLSALCSAAPTLEFVQIVTRHGARTPFDDIPNNPVEWICEVSPLSTPQLGTASSFESDGRLYRKSYLTGREFLIGNCSTGQLTAVGLLQHYELGRQFRSRYVDQLGFLSKELNLEEMFIRSADVERCVQSAQSQLLGMYPPQHGPNPIRVVPIHTIEQALDDVETSGRCPRLVQLCNELQNTTEWNQYLNQFNPLQQSLIKAWNLTSTPQYIPEWDDVFDMIESRKYDGQPFPPGINASIADQIVSIASGELARLWNSTERVQLGIGQFMFEIYTRFSEFISRRENKSFEPNFGKFPKFANFFPKNAANVKYILYSAHDITCSLVLAGLGVFDGRWPKYASHIQMELYSDQGQWKVGVLYNDKEMFLPGCSNQWLCDWGKFESTVQKVLIKTEQEFINLCQVSAPVVPLSGLSEYVC